MGTFSEWSYTSRCTVWEPTLDTYGQPSSYARTVYNCSWIKGGDLAIDENGSEFRPRTRIYMAAEDADAPAVGSYVALIVSTAANPPTNAEVIRAVVTHDPSTFDEGAPDREVLTG